MAIRNIRKEDDEILRMTCKPVAQVTEDTRRLIRDMFETMYANNGVGLAAPQIGIVRRIVVIDDAEGHRYALVNPHIVSVSGEQNSQEGCLSLPGYRGRVRRPEHVKVEALDETGAPVTLEGEGLLAAIFCHELDHLDGVLYKDLAYRYERSSEKEGDEGSA